MKPSVIDFFCHAGTDPQGRSLADMIAMTDHELESHHDIIQWMFPLHEASQFNARAPLIDEASACSLQQSSIAKKRMREVLIRFAHFLGFEQLHNGEFVANPKLEANRANWQTPLNHNHLRITRVIRSLRLLGLEAESRAFYDAVYQAAKQSGCVNERTLAYWQRALERPPLESLR